MDFWPGSLVCGLLPAAESGVPRFLGIYMSTQPRSHDDEVVELTIRVTVAGPASCHALSQPLSNAMPCRAPVWLHPLS